MFFLNACGLGVSGGKAQPGIWCVRLQPQSPRMTHVGGVKPGGPLRVDFPWGMCGLFQGDQKDWVSPRKGKHSRLLQVSDGEGGRGWKHQGEGGELRENTPETQCATFPKQAARTSTEILEITTEHFLGVWQLGIHGAQWGGGV